MEQSSEIPADEYYEFIQKCKKIEQESRFPCYSEQIQEMFGVTEIDQIFFEYQDGSGDHFTELFEYRATVGIGGFGFVIAALDKETGEEIAIKMLNLNYSSGVQVKLRIRISIPLCIIILKIIAVIISYKLYFKPIDA